MKITVRIAVLLFAFALVAAACSGGGDDAAMTTTGAIGAEESARDAVPGTTSAAVTTTAAPASGEGGAGEAPTDAVPAATTLDPAALGRSIIYTASITVEVTDVVAAGEQVRAAIAGLGGILFGQETTTGESARSVLTIKVRPEDFETALDRLAGIGTLVEQTVFADDVTERVDLRSRITTAEASVERLRTFLEGATDLEDVATLEQELLRRETDLELLRGQVRTLEDAVALATIVIVLTEPVEPRPEASMEIGVTGYADHDGGTSCPGADDVVVPEGDPLTFCVTVDNTGTLGLADVEPRFLRYDARPSDFVVVSGDPGAILLPGERIVFVLEVDADYPASGTPSADAVAVDASGERLFIEIEVSGEPLRLEVEEDTSLPGFGDALGAAWDALGTVFGVVVVLAGAAIPFLWVPLALAGLWLWRRRRRAEPSPPPGPPADDGDAAAA